jgi:hypothetical protein
MIKAHMVSMIARIRAKENTGTCVTFLPSRPNFIPPSLDANLLYNNALK